MRGSALLEVMASELEQELCLRPEVVRQAWLGDARALGDQK